MITPVSRCRSCGAPIVWTITEDGQRMPCDPHPVVGGNIRIIRGPDTTRSKVVGATIDLYDPGDNGDRHVAHYVTCPCAGRAS